MAIYKKNTPVEGNWIKGEAVKSGGKCKLVGETNPRESQYKKEDGTPKMQDVSKIKFEGDPEIYNIGINRASINALVDAFGEDSKNWMNKILTAITEKVVVFGKRRTALYLVPEGYEVGETEDGFVKIERMGGKKEEDIPEIEPDEDEIKSVDIPF